MPIGVDTIHIEIYDERAFTNDEKVAWALYTIADDVLSGQTREEWIPLNGRQGDGKEGSIGVVMSFTVRACYTFYFRRRVKAISGAESALPARL